MEVNKHIEGALQSYIYGWRATRYQAKQLKLGVSGGKRAQLELGKHL